MINNERKKMVILLNLSMFFSARNKPVKVSKVLLELMTEKFSSFLYVTVTNSPPPIHLCYFYHSTRLGSVSILGYT